MDSAWLHWFSEPWLDFFCLLSDCKHKLAFTVGANSSGGRHEEEGGSSDTCRWSNKLFVVAFGSFGRFAGLQIRSAAEGSSEVTLVFFCCSQVCCKLRDVQACTSRQLAANEEVQQQFASLQIACEDFVTAQSICKLAYTLAVTVPNRAARQCTSLCIAGQQL
jgi:hypothetical protein